MPLVEFRDVSYEIERRPILSHINLAVEAGETLVLLGRSGSGKSTALKLTNGMLFPTAGQVLVEGAPLVERQRRPHHRDRRRTFPHERLRGRNDCDRNRAEDR